MQWDAVRMGKHAVLKTPMARGGCGSAVRAFWALISVIKGPEPELLSSALRESGKYYGSERKRGNCKSCSTFIDVVFRHPLQPDYIGLPRSIASRLPSFPVLGLSNLLLQSVAT